MSIKPNEIRRARPLLGTFVEITAADTLGGNTEVAIDAAFDAVALVQRLMSFYEPDSDVSRLNREAWRSPVAIHPWTHHVLEAAVDLHRRSAGIFNIAIASALQALQLLPGIPYDETTLAPVGVIGLLPDYCVRFGHPGVRIDLGGIAKGFAVDQAVAVLRERGISRGLINAGGDMFVFGQPSYTVYIRNPRNPSQLMSQVELRDEALASSGNCFDPFPMAIRPESAVIDPRVGAPVNRVVGVSVRASSCMIADALTKFVMITGEFSRSLLDFYRAGALFVSADGSVYITSNWQAECIDNGILTGRLEKEVN